MTKDQLQRVRQIARSGVVGGEIRALVDAFDDAALALRKYGNHHDYCKLRRGEDCDCGLRAALAAAETEAKHG